MALVLLELHCPDDKVDSVAKNIKQGMAHQEFHYFLSAFSDCSGYTIDTED
jgi:hypothetical protein